MPVQEPELPRALPNRARRRTRDHEHISAKHRKFASITASLAALTLHQPTSFAALHPPSRPVPPLASSQLLTSRKYLRIGRPLRDDNIVDSRTPLLVARPLTPTQRVTTPLLPFSSHTNAVSTGTQYLTSRSSSRKKLEKTQVFLACHQKTVSLLRLSPHARTASRL